MTDSAAILDRLVLLARGYRSTQAVYVMAKLGLADHMADGPATAEELSRKVGVDALSLGRVLRLAAFCGLVAEVPGDRFELTELGSPLRTGVEGSLRAFGVMLGEEHYAAWGSLLYSVQTAKPAFEHVYGAPFFDYMSTHPDAQATFDAAMSAGVDVMMNGLAQAFDYSRARVLVDVGGGNGSLAATVLKEHPGLEAVIYDQEHVLQAADAYLTEAGVRARCRLVPGNFFESVPAGGDVYLLSNIVHDWDDDRSLRILKNCRAAMSAEGVVLLVEIVMPEHGKATAAAMDDVNMLVLLTGRERTEKEYRSLLGEAGLSLQKVTRLTARESVIEARPV